MAVTSIDIEPGLLAQARELTGARSNREVVDLALRRLVAHKSKRTLLDRMSRLDDLPNGLGAGTVDYPTKS